MKRLLISTTIAAALASSSAIATPITFTGANGSFAASVTFDVSGSNLLATLTNTSRGDPGAPGDILTGVIFSILDNPLLTKVSATLHSGSTVIHGPTPATDPGNVVGGEWAYTNILSGAFVGQQSIYSSGYFSGTARFPGNNLQDPDSVDGIQYGITTLSDSSANDNHKIDKEGLIQNAVDFVLSGLPTTFSLGSITTVSFQYGTELTERNITGTCIGSCDGGGEVPEPTTMILVGAGLLGMAGLKRWRKKAA